ncbi:penicillin-binding protein 2, partial [Streptococcus pyogenes]
GRPLVDNKVVQVVSFTRSNRITATEMKSIAQKLVEFVAVSEVNVSRRDKADYYLADSTVYSEVVKALPREQRFDTDGNL